MGSLAFFPWMHIDSPITFGLYTLIPHRRGSMPQGLSPAELQDIDALLEAYRDCTGKAPVRKSTLMRVGGGAITRTLSPEETARALVFSELLTFSGLATRDFFFEMQYSNRELFRCFIWGFTDTKGGVTVRARMRDGEASLGYAPGLRIVLRPEYLREPVKLTLDEDFLRALQRAQATLPEEAWGAIYESILNFNLASTDSDTITQETEVILILAAFQRLLAVSYDTGETERQFSNVVAPAQDRFPGLEPRFVDLQAAQRTKPVRSIWIQRFCLLRNDLAHGHHRPLSPQYWTLREHLLLASFVFPLAVKRTLVNSGVYTLSSDDQTDIEVFEELAACEMFAPIGDGQEYPWHDIRTRSWFRRFG